MELILGDMQTGYIELRDAILADGVPSISRGQEHIQLLGATYRLISPEWCLATGINRKLNTKLAAVEALQLIAGVSVPQLMARVAPNTGRFLDGDIAVGAYAPRLRNQLTAALHRLITDTGTRQAVMTIYDPAADLHTYDDTPRDVPCTVGIQFIMHSGRLSMDVWMRSQDLFWGVPYDVVVFTQLLCTMANVLGVEIGEYVHHVTSLHIYTRDLDALKALTPPTDPVRLLNGLSSDAQQSSTEVRWSMIRYWARELLTTGIDKPLGVARDSTANWFVTLLTEAHSG